MPAPGDCPGAGGFCDAGNRRRRACAGIGKLQPDVPIVLMTGYILNDEEVISHLPGVVCYLKKPLDASQVVQVLKD